MTDSDPDGQDGDGEPGDHVHVFEADGSLAGVVFVRSHSPDPADLAPEDRPERATYLGLWGEFGECAERRLLERNVTSVRYPLKG